LGDHDEEETRKIDVYHHFDEETKELVRTLNKLLSSPISFDVVIGATGVPTTINVVFGTPVNDN